MNRNPAAHEDGERGQVLVVVALFCVAMIGILALVLDGGSLFVMRRRMQNASDAGSLAGARVLGLNGTSSAAQAAASEYTTTRNGASSAQITVQSPTVHVTVCGVAVLTFARAFGMSEQTICARAEAAFEPLGETGGAAPIAIRDFPYEFGAAYNIWDDTKDADPLSGNIQGGYRGWLCLDCVYPESCGACGASVLKDWMRNGYDGITSVGDWIRGDPGTKTSVIHQVTVGQRIKVVVYDEIEQKYPGKDYYHAVKLAVFKVTQVYDKGNPKGIRGVFEYSVEAGPPGTADGGLRMIRLTQ